MWDFQLALQNPCFILSRYRYWYNFMHFKRLHVVFKFDWCMRIVLFLSILFLERMLFILCCCWSLKLILMEVRSIQSKVKVIWPLIIFMSLPLSCSKVARAGKDPATLVCPIAPFHGTAKLWMTMVDMNISDYFQVHLSMENCMCKFVPPSCLQKKLFFGEEFRVAALGLVSLLILVSFGDLLVMVSLQPQFHWGSAMSKNHV